LDKLSKFLGLGYPGGPVIDELSRRGDPHKFHFSIPKISDGSLDFSFSGFKTAALRHIQSAGIRTDAGGRKSQKVLDLLASYQHVVVETLVSKTRTAVEKLHPRSVLLVGGVACNSLLRRTFKERFEHCRKSPGGRRIPVFYPQPLLTSDNAAMIAAAGTPKLVNPEPFSLDLNAYPDLRLC